MEKIKISVIIPVYNVEKYIEQCLESVVNQTLKEIEIIIVNDGTKDNSMKKIERFLSDKRIIVISKENGGLSSARNTGLKIAKGKYIAFVDSDDFIGKTMLEDLYNDSEDLDIVFSNFCYYTGTSIKYPKEISIINFITGGEYFYGYYSTMVWNKIYKNSFLKANNIKFLEGIIHEDDLFTFYTSFFAKKVKYVNKYHYYYRINRNGSIMQSLDRKKRIDAYKKINESISNFYDEKNIFKDFRIYLRKMYWIARLKELKKEKFSKKEIEDFEIKLKKYYEYNFTDIEKKILKDDIYSLFESKNFYKINIFDSFYWKKQLFTKKALRRILEQKLKNIFNSNI